MLMSSLLVTTACSHHGHRDNEHEQGHQHDGHEMHEDKNGDGDHHKQRRQKK